MATKGHIEHHDDIDIESCMTQYADPVVVVKSTFPKITANGRAFRRTGNGYWYVDAVPAPGPIIARRKEYWKSSVRSIQQQQRSSILTHIVLFSNPEPSIRLHVAPHYRIGKVPSALPTSRSCRR